MTFDDHVKNIAEKEARVLALKKKIRGLRISMAKVKHGNAFSTGPSPEYRSWCLMRRRCLRQYDPAFRDYGGRGIVICDEWKSFTAFLADMGPKPSPLHSLDRIDNNGPYGPDNCRWATKQQQARNRRSSTSLAFAGETKTLAEWAEVKGINRQTLTTRLRDGWSPERALTTPVRSRRMREAAE